MCQDVTKGSPDQAIFRADNSLKLTLLTMINSRFESLMVLDGS